MIRSILMTIAIFLVAFLLYAATRPAGFRVERTVHILATPAAIYPYLSDFHKGSLWVPYEKRDPAMKRIFSGPENGKGAVYEFEGHKEVGTGRREIIEAVKPTRVVLLLDMSKPFEEHNIVEYTITPRGGESDVSWAMSGTNTFLGKAFYSLFKMNEVIGKDFEVGLSNLKGIVENE